MFSDPRVAGYDQPGHPESAWRVTKTVQSLAGAGLKPERPSVAASEEDILSVHTPRHWEALRTGSFHDPDTPHFRGIHEIARISLSGALSALDSALSGTPAFSLMRPPGHHAAHERIAGFCYLNNIAIACDKALRSGRRVAVLDIDVHHGDGTQEIFMEREGLVFVSLHQHPLYPGTGAETRANCLNFPLPPNTSESAYLTALEQGIKRIADFKPDLLAISAGFDTYKECPLANLKLEKETYRKIGRMIAETKLPRFGVLEGGYAEDLPVLIENFLEGFSSGV